MKINNHRLFHGDGTPLPFVATPNLGGIMRPEDLVMHFTAGSSAESSIAWLSNTQAQASAHLVIARDGNITQMIPFNRIAWHAGKSFSSSIMLRFLRLVVENRRAYTSCTSTL